MAYETRGIEIQDGEVEIQVNEDASGLIAFRSGIYRAGEGDFDKHALISPVELAKNREGYTLRARFAGGMELVLPLGGFTLYDGDDVLAEQIEDFEMMVNAYLNVWLPHMGTDRGRTTGGGK